MAYRADFVSAAILDDSWKTTQYRRKGKAEVIFSAYLSPFRGSRASSFSELLYEKWKDAFLTAEEEIIGWEAIPKAVVPEGANPEP